GPGDGARQRLRQSCHDEEKPFPGNGIHTRETAIKEAADYSLFPAAPSRRLKNISWNDILNMRCLMMEIRVLRYFLMVAREENITKAAELLHITQPTLSRQLIQLETELGTKLFERSSHNIRLTEDGMLLKRRAQELVQLADKTEREFKRREEQLSGSIAIGSGETNNVQVLADIIRKFQAEYPLVQYDLYTANA